MMRPVKNLRTDSIEYIGSFEQVFHECFILLQFYYSLPVLQIEQSLAKFSYRQNVIIVNTKEKGSCI